ncbi:MAG: tyrosine-type recombinase/integrase [Rhodoferax sp.]
MEIYPSPSKTALPDSLFDAWASSRNSASRGLSEPTEAVQRAMWTAFGTWCIRNNIDAANLTANELGNYLRSREGTVPESELTPRYAWRLVNLIDRVLNFTASKQGRAPNRAAAEIFESYPELKHANAESMEPLPEYLSDSQDRTLVAFLEASASKGSSAAVLWQTIRNRTGVALQRGAGLTPLEIRMLKVSAVFVDLDTTRGPWKVRAPATGSVQAHDAPLAKWARPLLTYWMQLRTELGIPGDWLLPSTKSGKPWGKTAQFDAVADVFESAGLAGLKGGSYRLRHTFALRQLSRPQCDEEKVAQWMGIDAKEMSRYRGVMMVPVEVL